MTSLLSFENVSVLRNDKAILDSIDFQVKTGENWVILGPNGAGKSTLLKLASGHLYPTRGKVQLFEEKLGGTDVFELRPRIGAVSSALAKQIPDSETVRDVVLTAAYAVTGRWNEDYEDLDYARADEIIANWQITELSDRKFGTLSDGERKRVLLARALMTDPELLLLDEPASNLDLGNRESFLKLLSEFLADPAAPVVVMVTHHVEEIPAGFSNALLLKSGKIQALGSVEEVLNDQNFTELYNYPIRINKVDDRYFAKGL